MSLALASTYLGETVVAKDLRISMNQSHKSSSMSGHNKARPFSVGSFRRNCSGVAFGPEKGARPYFFTEVPNSLFSRSRCRSLRNQDLSFFSFFWRTALFGCSYVRIECRKSDWGFLLVFPAPSRHKLYCCAISVLYVLLLLLYSFVAG